LDPFFFGLSFPFPGFPSPGSSIVGPARRAEIFYGFKFHPFLFTPLVFRFVFPRPVPKLSFSRMLYREVRAVMAHCFPFFFAKRVRPLQPPTLSPRAGGSIPPAHMSGFQTRRDSPSPTPLPPRWSVVCQTMGRQLGGAPGLLDRHRTPAFNRFSLIFFPALPRALFSSDSKNFRRIKLLAAFSARRCSISLPSVCCESFSSLPLYLVIRRSFPSTSLSPFAFNGAGDSRKSAVSPFPPFAMNDPPPLREWSFLVCPPALVRVPFFCSRRCKNASPIS